MKYRPIIFSADELRSILEGRKTQTRRIINPQPEFKIYEDGLNVWLYIKKRCPYGRPFVRHQYFDLKPKNYHLRWESSPQNEHPRLESRITIEIISVGVERVQDIDRADAKSEGFHPSTGNGLESWDGKSYGNAELAFRACWDSLHAKRGFGWDANPWVWKIEFKRV